MTSTTETAELLRLYFIQQRAVNIPGIGGFALKRIPANFDHTSGLIEAPAYTIHYDSLNDIPSKEMFAYLSRKKDLSEWEAIGVVNSFSVALKDQLRKGQRFEWEGVGILENDPSGQLVFEPGEIVMDLLPSIPSGKIMEEADRNAYSSEAELYPGGEHEAIVKAKASWWITAAVIAAIALLLIFLNVISNEYRFSAAQQNKFVPAREPVQNMNKPAD